MFRNKGMMMKTMAVLAMSLITVIIFIVISTPTSENVIFVTKSYMKHDVIKNSPYFTRMNEQNLRVRNSQTVEEYRERYTNEIQYFTEPEKAIIVNVIRNISVHLKFFDKLDSITWKIAKISEDIEMGFPHTLGDVIILGDSFFNLIYEQQLVTLLHEKIHVYQRLYPLETHELILNVMGFQIKRENPSLNDMKRNNPDINDLTYGKHDFLTMQIFSNKAETLMDSAPMKVNEKSLEMSNINVVKDLDIPVFITQLEHPFEIMASYLPYILLHRITYDLIPKNVIGWIKKYC